MNSRAKKGIATLGLLGATTFGVDASVMQETPLELSEVVKNERVEVKQVGNVVETKLPWKGQPGATVKYDMGEPTLPERVADKRKAEVVTEALEDGFKIDVLLNEKPDTNVFNFEIEGHEELDFFYQPELTEEEIAEGASRPENVVGSYAVYHKSLKNNDYQTGKLYHIYRPLIVDSDGQEVWGEMNFNEGVLSVTVPQDFLDKATYPVRVDPTFGYLSLGASDVDICSNNNDRSGMYGVAVTLSENGIVDTITAGLKSNGNPQTIDHFVGIYDKDSAGTDSHDLVSSGEILDLGVNGTGAFYDFTGDGAALSNGDYILATLCNGEDLPDAVTTGDFLYDSAPSSTQYSENTTGPGSYNTRKTEDPWTETASASSPRSYSMYVTYSLEGEGPAIGSVHIESSIKLEGNVNIE